MDMTYNFLPANDSSIIIPEEYNKLYVDGRNNIRCMGITADLECYINYIRLLNGLRDRWVGFGYLDLGMIPAAMGPSFMHRAVTEVMSKLLGIKGVRAYALPSVSFLCDSRRLGTKDIWVFREDAAKAMGKDTVTTEEFIRWCWNDVDRIK